MSSNEQRVGQVVHGDLRTVSGDLRGFQEGASREGWGPGPWDGEPDRYDWTTAVGLPGLAHRAPMGNWCGYVAVKRGHPLHGKRAEDGETLSVHGGVTYSAACAGSICHVPKPGESDDIWWIGFDCGHSMDLMPQIEAYMRRGDVDLTGAGRPPPAPIGLGRGEGLEGLSTYRSLEYVKGEVESLTEQLAALTS